MSVTSTDTVITAPFSKSIQSLGSSLGSLPPRQKSSQIRQVYKQASTYFLQRDFADAFVTLEAILTAPRHSEDDFATEDDTEKLPPIATASRSSRIKVWSLYVTLLNAIIELGPEEGKAAVGIKQWREIAAKARDGSIWDEVVRIGYGGIEGNVDADVVFNLANLLLSQSASQTTNQQHLETYLATSDLSRTPRADHPTPNDTSDLRDLASRIKLLELYILHVLPANEEWDYAKDFIQMSDLLDDDHKEAFHQALDGLEAAKTQVHQQQQRHEEDIIRDLQAAEPKPIDDHEQPSGHRRTNSERDYGIEEVKELPPKAKDPDDSRPASRGNAKMKPQRDVKPTPSKVSPRRPANAGIVRRSVAFILAFQNLISNMTQSLSKNPLAMFRFVLFLIALLVALSRRDVKERIERIARGGWDEVRRTVGMGVKPSVKYPTAADDLNDMELQEPILEGKYPAKDHCAKVTAYLQSKYHVSSDSILYLEGQKSILLEDSDEAQPFRQRRSFFYLSGCALPDCHLIYNVSTSSLTLFIPPLDPDSVIWSGLPLLPPDALKEYDIDACLTTSELSKHLSQLQNHEPKPTLYLKTDAVTSELSSAVAALSTDTSLLHPAIDECRVTKDAYEIALLRHANAISTRAHTAVLRAIPAARNEQDLEAVFIASCIASGAKHQAYHGIFGSGANAATLHYQHNDQALHGRKNILVDAGAEWSCYCSDVTRTAPLGGGGGGGVSFDAESRDIYSLVQEMQAAAFALLKAGVRWETLHLRAHEVAIAGLLRIGILRDGTPEELLRERVSAAFFPHGLGHYLGMDTHDTGGGADYGDQDTMFRYLRIRGEVPEGSVVTVEPGVYFCRFIVEPYLKDERTKRFIDDEVLDRFWDVGGVRIEDDVLVTKDGYENLTTAPKGIEEMERIIAGGN
ncbi:MAG: hypothetical protein LQ344_002111 [Seirophora lacunosa]|nr:MAG: hypothetical protein LQ344_002111 [Seirophora lacunosa]